jgi:hypothetical protein
MKSGWKTCMAVVFESNWHIRPFSAGLVQVIQCFARSSVISGRSSRSERRDAGNTLGATHLALNRAPCADALR